MNFDADDKKMLQVNILFLKRCQSYFCFMLFKFMKYISEKYHGCHKQSFFKNSMRYLPFEYITMFWFICIITNAKFNNKKNIINDIDKEKKAIYEANPLLDTSSHSISLLFV